MASFGILGERYLSTDRRVAPPYDTDILLLPEQSRMKRCVQAQEIRKESRRKIKVAGKSSRRRRLEDVAPSMDAQNNC